MWAGGLMAGVQIYCAPPDDYSKEKKMPLNWREHSVSTADVLRGKPRIKGTRLPASLVLGYLAAGHTYEEILHEFPDLIQEQIGDRAPRVGDGSRVAAGAEDGDSPYAQRSGALLSGGVSGGAPSALRMWPGSPRVGPPGVTRAGRLGERWEGHGCVSQNLRILLANPEISFYCTIIKFLIF